MGHAPGKRDFESLVDVFARTLVRPVIASGSPWACGDLMRWLGVFGLPRGRQAAHSA